MATSVGVLKSVLTLDVAGFGKGINRAIKDVNRFQRTMGNVSRALSFFGGAFGLGFTGTAIVRGLTRRVDQINELANEAQKTGVSLKSLGVHLNEVAVRDVQRANAEVVKLKSSWREFADTIVANVAPRLEGVSRQMRNILDIGKDIGAFVTGINPPSGPGSPLTAPRSRPSEAADAAAMRTGALRTHVSAARARMTPERQAEMLRAARVRISNARQDAMELAAAQRAEQRQLDNIRRKEVLDRRAIINGRTSRGPMQLRNETFLGTPVPSRNGTPNNSERSLKKIEENTFDMLKEMQRLDEAWQREMERRSQESNGGGGVSIN